jgi:hypothetical protein
MDVVGLITLRQELADDCRLLRETAEKCAAHLRDIHSGRLEAAAFELARSYNIIEQAGLRVAREFENQIEKDGGWHEGLLRRLTLEIPGIRPPFFPAALRPALDELRRFRHFVHHAYDVELREDRIQELAATVQSLGRAMGETCEDFVRQVARANGWTLPS